MKILIIMILMLTSSVSSSSLWKQDVIQPEKVVQKLSTSIVSKGLTVISKVQELFKTKMIAITKAFARRCPVKEAFLKN